MMKPINMPAWATICTRSLVSALLGISATVFLAILMSHITGPAGYVLSFLADLVAAYGLWVFVGCGAKEMRALIAGDVIRLATYNAAWHKTKLAPAKFLREIRHFRETTSPDYLREWGAVSVDLVDYARKSTGRQSGHRNRAGHKKPASSSDDGDGEPPASLPLILTVHDLARLLQVSAKTLQNKPKSTLPPAVFIPACRGPRYHRHDVITWLDSFTHAKTQKKSDGKIGRPRLATPEQITAARGKGGVQ